MTGLFIAIVIALLITCLVVRDQTEFKLGKMRSDLLGLRTEEKRVEEARTEVEQMVRWVGEALNRADKRQRTAEQDGRALENILNRMGIELKTDATVAAAPAQDSGKS